MVRPGLRRCYAINEARRDRKSAPLSGEDLISKISENIRFMQKISKENVDEAYFECLKDYYFYDINSLSCTNEDGNDGWFNEVDDEDEADPQHMMIDGSTEGLEIDDEDEADTQYELFLANCKPDGQFYVFKVDSKDGSPVLIKYEKERRKKMKKQKNAVKEKTLVNTSSKDEAQSQRVSRTVPGFDNSRSMALVIHEPSDPVSQRKNGIMNRKLSVVKSGASKRQGKRGSKIKSGHRVVIGKGSKPVNFTGKEKVSDVDENFMLCLEKMKASLRNGNADEDYMFLLKNHPLWGMKVSSKNGKAAEDDIEVLDNNSGMLKNVDNLTGCPQMSVRSAFREKVMDLLKKRYDSNEYKELWTEVNNRKLMERNIELRNGEVKNYKTQQLGKSYLDHYEDLKEKLAKIGKRKKLKILRGFFFWLQNLGHADAFAPWKDVEFLALVG